MDDTIPGKVEGDISIRSGSVEAASQGPPASSSTNNVPGEAKSGSASAQTESGYAVEDEHIKRTGGVNSMGKDEPALERKYSGAATPPNFYRDKPSTGYKPYEIPLGYIPPSPPNATSGYQEFDEKSRTSTDRQPVNESILTLLDATYPICTYVSMRGTYAQGYRRLVFHQMEFATSFYPDQLYSESSDGYEDPLLLIIENWDASCLHLLQATLPNFPMETLLHFNSPSASSMLPLVGQDEEVTCIMEHIELSSNGANTPVDEDLIDIGLTKARCCSTVVWTSRRAEIEGYFPRPMIVLISGSAMRISERIRHHYEETDYKRWDRLAGDLTWVYLDMYFLFTKWDRVWGAVKQNLKERIAEVEGQRPALPILQQTRQLHQDNNVMISLREHLRIHKASIERVKAGPYNRNSDVPVELKLQQRLSSALQLLEYYDMTATSLLEQQSNLLSLAFNIETVSQGQAVARLNALAFIFLPISFAASVFGITTFAIDAVWYPAFALPLLATTTVIAVIIDKYSAARQVRSGSKRGYARGSPGDIEGKIRKSDTSNIRSWPSKALNFLSYNKKSTSRTNKNVPSFGGVAPESSALNDPSRITRADRTDTKESSVPEAALPTTLSQRFESALQYVPASHMTKVGLESDQTPVQHNVNFVRRISKPGGRYAQQKADDGKQKQHVVLELPRVEFTSAPAMLPSAFPRAPPLPSLSKLGLPVPGPQGFTPPQHQAAPSKQRQKVALPLPQVKQGSLPMMVPSAFPSTSPPWKSNDPTPVPGPQRLPPSQSRLWVAPYPPDRDTILLPPPRTPAPVFRQKMTPKPTQKQNQTQIPKPETWQRPDIDPHSRFAANLAILPSAFPQAIPYRNSHLSATGEPATPLAGEFSINAMDVMGLPARGDALIESGEGINTAGVDAIAVDVAADFTAEAEAGTEAGTTMARKESEGALETIPEIKC